MPGNALGCRIAHKALISSLVMGFVLAAGLDAACAQKVTTFPVPFVIGLTNGPDGALWFADISNQPHIGRITTAGAVTDFPLPANSTSGVAIVSGPDGALWFTELGGTIGRITTDGQLTEFAIPTANSSPFGITVGPDGALWFTETSAGRIGRITTAGVISEFPTLSANSGPGALPQEPMARCGLPRKV